MAVILLIKYICMMYLLFLSFKAIDGICDSIHLLHYNRMIQLGTKDFLYAIHMCSMIGCELFGQYCIATTDMTLSDMVDVGSLKIIIWVFVMVVVLYALPRVVSDLINATGKILDKDDKYARKICTAILCITLILIPFSIPLLSYGMF